MADLVADIDGPPMTERAWRAGQRSRRRRAVGTAVAGVLLVGAGVAVADAVLSERSVSREANGGIRDATPSAGPPAALAPAPGEPRVQTGPERAAVAGLPTLPTRFAALSSPPSSAEALSARPVSRIVAAVQAGDGPVLVLGQDGRWRQADNGLDLPPDQDGNRPPWLVSTSISPDGRRLALVHGAGLLLIDATTGEHRLLPVPGSFGRIDNMLWLPDGDRVAVSGDSGAGVVSTRDGSFESTEDPLHNLAVSRPGEPAVYLDPAALVVQDARTTVRRMYGTGARIVFDEWYGGGWVNGSSAVSAGFLGGREHDGEQATLVVDVTTARVTHLLTIPRGRPPAIRSNGCCAALGWLDDKTVLLRDGGQVLAWRYTSGAVYRVARLPGTTAQGADPGYDTTIALAQP
jgi:hypothetical protein